MDSKTFITSHREAFGPSTTLPIVSWYSDTPVGSTEHIGSCLFKCMPMSVRVKRSA